ncbi:Intersectin-2, partial [Dissostichus eleginoides]
PPAHQSLSIPPPSSPPMLHNDRAAPVSGLLDARSGTFCPLAAFKLWADSKVGQSSCSGTTQSHISSTPLPPFMVALVDLIGFSVESRGGMFRVQKVHTQ